MPCLRLANPRRGRIMDKDEDKNHDFFVVKENLIAEIDSSKATPEEVKEETKLVEHKLS